MVCTQTICLDNRFLRLSIGFLLWHFRISRERAWLTKVLRNLATSDPDLQLQNSSDDGSQISTVGNVDNEQGICEATAMTVMKWDLCHVRNPIGFRCSEGNKYKNSNPARAKSVIRRNRFSSHGVTNLLTSCWMVSQMLQKMAAPEVIRFFR